MYKAFCVPSTFAVVAPRASNFSCFSAFNRFKNLPSRRAFVTNMKSSSQVTGVVQPAWLAQNLNNVTVLDASWHLSKDNRDPEADFLTSRIPGAVRFDIDADGLSDVSSNFKHMLPKAPEHFAKAVRALGVSKSKPVVVYSKKGFYGAARAWWMFRLYGKDDVGVLDGGFAQWEAEGHPLSSGPSDPAVPVPESEAFVPVHRPGLARNMPQMLEHTAVEDATVIDVRSALRFNEVGHIPKSMNLPYAELLDPETGKMKQKNDLITVLKNYGVPLNSQVKKPAVTTCGSGVTACIVALAIHLADDQDVAIYDGSWTEYSSHTQNPIEGGPTKK